MTEINFRIAVLTVRLPSCSCYFIRTRTLCFWVTGLAAGIQAGRIWPLPCNHPRHRSALWHGAKTLQHHQWNRHLCWNVRGENEGDCCCQCECYFSDRVFYLKCLHEVSSILAMNFEGKWETKLLCFIAVSLTIVTIRYIVIFRYVVLPLCSSYFHQCWRCSTGAASEALQKATSLTNFQHMKLKVVVIFTCHHQRWGVAPLTYLLTYLLHGAESFLRS